MTNVYYKIAGLGQTKFGELYDYSIEDLIFEATNLALSEAKLSINDIDSVFIGNMIAGEVSGQSHLGAIFADLFNFNGPVIRVEGACASGGLAVYSALQSLKAKTSKNVLVIGAEKMTDFDSNIIGDCLMQAASQQERDAGLSFPGLYALMTQSYIQKFGLSRNDLSLAPYLMHKNALNNPKAQFQKEFTIEQISNSNKIADPIRILDCSPISDGAAAIIITTESQLEADTAYLADVEVATDSASISNRENQYSINSTKLASKKIYARNNVSATMVNVVEVHDCFSIGLFMAMEDLGFCLQGKCAELLKDICDGKSDLVLNPSGGLKACGHPVGASGVKQILEVSKNIIGSQELRIGLAQNVGGSGGTAVVSLIVNDKYFSL